MKSLPIFFAAFLVLLCACTSVRESSIASPVLQEQIVKAILENIFTERESEYSANFQKYRDEKKDLLDPFGGAVIDDRLTVIYEPFCVLILGRDPSSRFLQTLDRRQHPIRPGSAFTPHPTKFATSEDRARFIFSNPPGLFSISKIEVPGDGKTVVASLVIYRHGLNSEGWSYILRKEAGRWTVTSKKMTYIS